APPPKLWTTLRWSKGKPAAGWHPKRRIERQNRPEAREPGAALRCEQARQESNLQPPVLETGALPIELRTYKLTLPEVTASNPAAAPSQPSSCQAVDSQRLRVARAVLGAPYVGSRRMRATPTQPTHRAVRQPRRRPCQ